MGIPDEGIKPQKKDGAWWIAFPVRSFYLYNLLSELVSGKTLHHRA